MLLFVLRLVVVIWDGSSNEKLGKSLMCLEEAGYNFIFVETMGVGQAETAVYDMVDIFLVLYVTPSRR